MGRHFVLVLFPDHLTDIEASAYLLRAMQSYDQQFDAFSSYHYPCLCTLTDDAGYTGANAEIGDFRTLWALYQLLPVDQRPAWSDYIAPWEEMADLAARLSPHYQAPEADCPHCEGSGLMRVSSALGGCPPLTLYTRYSRSTHTVFRTKTRKKPTPLSPCTTLEETRLALG